MVLPQGVSKATGLHAALRLLRRSEHNAVGVGDAENDHALLGACELGVAVGWGSPALQATASALGMDARGSTPQEMRDRMAGDVKKWAAVIDKAGIEKQ